MCFFYQINKTGNELEKRFNAKLDNNQAEVFYKKYQEAYNGFAHPFMPIISNTKPQRIQFYQWGLLPKWAKDKTFQKNTLNARIETLKEKPSFKNNLENRCLILTNGFFEWQWQDPKGKQKIKYLLQVSDSPIFAFAGLWSKWTNKNTGEIIPTFTIITTDANPLMAEIHNTKKRMPIILKPEFEKEYLLTGNIQMANDSLFATRVI